MVRARGFLTEVPQEQRGYAQLVCTHAPFGRPRSGRVNRGTCSTRTRRRDGSLRIPHRLCRQASRHRACRGNPAHRIVSCARLGVTSVRVHRRAFQIDYRDVDGGCNPSSSRAPAVARQACVVGHLRLLQLLGHVSDGRSCPREPSPDWKRQHGFEMRLPFVRAQAASSYDARLVVMAGATLESADHASRDRVSFASSADAAPFRSPTGARRRSTPTR